VPGRHGGYPENACERLNFLGLNICFDEQHASLVVKRNVQSEYGGRAPHAMILSDLHTPELKMRIL